MFQQCEDCNRRYDDEYKNTICPHYPLGTSPQSYCRTHDFFKPCRMCAAEEQFRESQGKRGFGILIMLGFVIVFWGFFIGWWWTGRIGWFLSWI